QPFDSAVHGVISPRRTDDVPEPRPSTFYRHGPSASLLVYDDAAVDAVQAVIIWKGADELPHLSKCMRARIGHLQDVNGKLSEADGEGLVPDRREEAIELSRQVFYGEVVHDDRI